MGRGDAQDHRIGLRLLGSKESPDLPELLDKFMNKEATHSVPSAKTIETALDIEGRVTGLA